MNMLMQFLGFVVVLASVLGFLFFITFLSHYGRYGDYNFKNNLKTYWEIIKYGLGIRQ